MLGLERSRSISGDELRNAEYTEYKNNRRQRAFLWMQTCDENYAYSSISWRDNGNNERYLFGKRLHFLI